MKKLFTITLFSIISSVNFLVAQDIYEPNDQFSNPTVINCNNNYEAYIQSVGDVDWYQVLVNQSGTISVEITSVPSNLDLNLEIYQFVNNQLKLIADDDDGNAGGGQNLTATAFVNAGTYLILVEDEDNNTSNISESYFLSVNCTENLFEINQTIDLAMLIPQDTCFQDNIWGENECFSTTGDGDDDQDWFQVEINESGKLNVAITAVPFNLDLNLEIYSLQNNQPKLIADDDDGNSGGGQELEATAYLNPGTYYIHIEDEDHNTTNEETYSFCVRFIPNESEINQTIDLAVLIPNDTCFQDNIWGENECFSTTNEGDDDQDWFQIEIDESGKLNVTLTAVPSNLDLNLEIYSIQNNQPKLIADDDDGNSGGGQDLEATAYLNPGTYYIHIEDEDHNTTNEETYSFCVRFIPNESEINQTIDLAVLIPNDTCFQDNIWGENECFSTTNEGDDDQDWFQVEINESGKLNVALNAVPSNLDLNLEIYSIQNNQPKLIADDDDGNSGGGQNLEATAYLNAGTYYIHIEDEDHNTTNEETYSFCVRFIPNESEINQTIDLATSIPQDTCFQDNIWGENECFSTTNEGDDDQDWFQVEIEESGKLNVSIEEVPSNLDLNLEIYSIQNNQPKLIADDDDGNSGGGQNLEATAYISAGTYYIHIEDEDHNTTNEETYSFCVRFIPNQSEINQTIELAASISNDTCFQENIWGENECFSTTNEGDDDQDWFQLTIDTACLLNIELTNVPNILDLNLELFEIVNGQSILVTDDGDSNSGGGQELSIIQNLEPGNYYIHIEDENHNATIEDFFTFCVSCEIMVSTKEWYDSQVNIFPNPTTGLIHVFGLDPNTHYTITDLSGKNVIADQLINNEIDLSYLVNGLYFISFVNEDRIFTKKIIKD